MHLLLRSFDEFIYGHPFTAYRSVAVLVAIVVLCLVLGVRRGRC